MIDELVGGCDLYSLDTVCATLYICYHVNTVVYWSVCQYQLIHINTIITQLCLDVTCLQDHK